MWIGQVCAMSRGPAGQLCATGVQAKWQAYSTAVSNKFCVVGMNRAHHSQLIRDSEFLHHDSFVFPGSWLLPELLLQSRTCLSSDSPALTFCCIHLETNHLQVGTFPPSSVPNPSLVRFMSTLLTWLVYISSPSSLNKEEAQHEHHQP